MRILSVTLEYLYGDGKDELKQKRLAILKNFGISVREDDLENPTIAVTDAQYIDLLMAGQTGTVRSSNLMTDGYSGTSERMDALAAKIDTFMDRGENMFNEKVNVYTPGMGLMLFNRVMLREDTCSDDLQACLDSGWRIIAACPQPDQRRPDYILGRYDPEYALESGANNHALRG